MLPGEDGLWPLIKAHNKPEFLDLLLAYGVDANRVNAAGLTTVLFAARANNGIVIEKLVSHGAAIDMLTTDGENQTNPLGWACKHQAQNAATVLLHHGANLNTTLGNHRTSLMFAAETGNVFITQALLDAGADTEITESTNGWTALHFAASNGKRVVAKILKERGAVLSAKDKSGKTAFALAEEKGHSETSRVLSRPSEENG